MGKVDGWRHITNANNKYENDEWDRKKYELEVMFGILEISQEDEKEAERVAKSHGFTLKEIREKFKNKM